MSTKKDITQTGVQNHRDLTFELESYYTGMGEDIPDEIKAIANIGPFSRMNTIRQQLYVPDTVKLEDLGVASDYGNSRYDTKQGATLDEMLNYQDLRGQRQSGIAKLGAGIGKGVALAGTTLIDGTLGLFYGVGQGLAEGRISALWDNDVSNALQDINKSLEEILPNYRTQEEMDRPWYRNLGTMNFWADSVIKNLGFTVGAFYSGMAWTKAFKAMGILQKGMSAQVVGSFMSGLNEGRIEANNGQRDFLELENMKIDDAIEQRKKAVFADNSMTDDEKISALMQLDQDGENLKQDALKRAHQMGLTTLIGNTVLLTASNMWQFGKLYSRGFANHAKVKAAAEAATKAAGKKVDAIVGEIPTAMEEGARMKAADEMMKKVGNRYLANITGKGKAALKGASNGLAEGFEEMNQQWIQSGAGEWFSPDSPDAYYEALVNHQSQLDTQGCLTGLAKGFTESYGDGSQWEQFAVGALTGLFGMPTFGRVNNADANTYIGRGKAIGISGGIFGEMRSIAEQNRVNEATANTMNKYLDKIEQQTSHFVQSKSFTDAMDGWAESKNTFEYQNASDNDDFAAIAAFARAGRMDDLREIIGQDFENISDEELASIARNSTPNLKVNEEGNVETKDENGNTLTGGWRAADGTLLSDTEEGRKQMREELIKKRDKLKKEADEYTKSVDLVRGIANNSLTDDQVNELAWLHWKGKMFTDRYNSIKGEQGETLQKLRQIANEISEAPFENSRDVLLTDLKNKWDDISTDRQSIEEALNLYSQEETRLREQLNQAKEQLSRLQGVEAARASVIQGEQKRGIVSIEKAQEKSKERKLNAKQRGKLNRQLKQERAETLKRIAEEQSEAKSRREKINQLENRITQLKRQGTEVSRRKLEAKKRLPLAKQAEIDAKHEYDEVFYNDNTEVLKSLHETQAKAAGNIRDFLDYLNTAESPIALASRIEANGHIVEALNNPVIKAMLQSRLGQDNESIDSFLSSLQDTAKIAKAAKAFNERFNEFKKNPLNLQKRRNKIQQKAATIKKSIDDSKKRKTVENATVNDLVNSDLNLDDLESALGDDTPDENGRTTTQGESKQKVKEAKKIRQQVDDMKSAINNSNAPEQTKKDAEVLLNNGQLNAEDYDQLNDFSREAYNDPSILDPSMSASTMPSAEEMQANMQQRIDEAKSLLAEAQATVSEQNMGGDQILQWGQEADDEFAQLMNNIASAEEVAAETPVTGHDSVDTTPSIQQETQARQQAVAQAQAAQNNPMRAGNQADMILDEMGLDKEQYHEIASNLVQTFYNMTKNGVSAKDALITIMQNTDFAPITDGGMVALQNFVSRWLEYKQQQGQPVVQETEQEELSETPTPVISQDDVTKEQNNDNTRIDNSNNQELANDYQYWKTTTTMMPIHQIGRGRKFYSKEFLDTTNYPESVKKRIQAVGEYLENTGAFDRVDRGEVQAGDEVHFVIDSALNEKAGEVIILMADKNGNIIGDVMSPNDSVASRQAGLLPFIQRVQKEYQEAGSPEHFTSKETSEVSQLMIGKVPYSQDRHTLNEVHTDSNNGKEIPFKLGVVRIGGREAWIASTPGRTKRQGKSEQDRSILPPLNAKTGQPYLLMPTNDKKGGRQWITVPFIMETFGPNTMNTQLGQAIQNAVRNIVKGNDANIKELSDSLQELLAAEIHINYDKQGNLSIKIGQGETGRIIFNTKNTNPGVLNNLNDETIDNLTQQITLGLQGLPFQVSRKYINSTYKGQDYNRMIGEVATVNLAIGDTHTISNWFTIKPIDENGNAVKAKRVKTTKVNPNAASSKQLITFSTPKGSTVEVDLTTNEVYVNGNLYTENANVRDRMLAFAYGLHTGKDMTKPYQSEWGYFNPLTIKFEAAPASTYSPVNDDSLNMDDFPSLQDVAQNAPNQTPNTTNANSNKDITITTSQQTTNNNTETSQITDEQINDIFVELFHQNTLDDEGNITNSHVKFNREKALMTARRWAEDYYDNNIAKDENDPHHNLSKEEFVKAQLRQVEAFLISAPKRIRNGQYALSPSMSYALNVATGYSMTTVRFYSRIKQLANQSSENSSINNNSGTTTETTITTDSGKEVKVSITYDSNNTLKDRLANTHYNNDGSYTITINNNINLDQFFDYLFGKGVKEGDNTSQAQKTVVLNRIELAGFTEDNLKELINTTEKAKELLLEHELSHVKHEHRIGYFDEGEDRKNPNYLTDKKVDREYQATMDAIRAIANKYASDNVKMAQSMYGSYFEGGGAVLEYDYKIDFNDAEAAKAISDFENGIMQNIITNSVAKKFLEVIKKYAPEQYAWDKAAYLSQQTNQSSENSSINNQNVNNTSSRPQTDNQNQDSLQAGVEKVTNATVQKSFEDQAKAKGFLNDAVSKKAFLALNPNQQEALLNIGGPKDRQLMIQLKLHFKVRENKFNINVDQLLGIEGKYRKLRDTSEDSRPFDLEKDLSKELRWLSKALPQFSKEDRVQLVKGLVTMDGSTTALGMLKNGIIYLNSSKQRRGTVYHEAFHAVFDTLLSEDERNTIYEAARETFGNLDTLSLEEKLAEDFRQYVEYEEYIPYEGLRGKVVKFWRKLKRMVNHLLGKDSTLNALFYNINRGKLASNKINNRNTIKDRLLNSELQEQEMELESMERSLEEMKSKMPTYDNVQDEVMAINKIFANLNSGQGLPVTGFHGEQAKVKNPITKVNGRYFISHGTVYNNAGIKTAEVGNKNVLRALQRKMQELGINSLLSFKESGDNIEVVISDDALFNQSMLSPQIAQLEKDVETQRKLVERLRYNDSISSSMDFERLDAEDQMQILNDGIPQEEYDDMRLVEKEFLLRHCR